MDDQQDIKKRQEKIQTIIVLSPFVFLLIWNAVFFYTDWWEIYLKPIGLHTWLDSLHWLRPIYDGLETRIYQHNVDAQKYMVLLSWGILWAIVFGLFLLIMTFKWSKFENSRTIVQSNTKINISLYLVLFSGFVLFLVAPYVFTKIYGQFPVLYAASLIKTPSYVSLLFLQVMYLSMVCFSPLLGFLVMYLLILDWKRWKFQNTNV